MWPTEGSVAVMQQGYYPKLAASVEAPDNCTRPLRADN